MVSMTPSRRIASEVFEGEKRLRRTNTELWPYVILGHSLVQVHTVLGPLSVPQTMRTSDDLIPSFAQNLAGRMAPLYDTYQIDLSYDPATIPVISVADLLSGKVSKERLSGRTIFITSLADLSRDTVFTPLNRYAPYSTVTILGVETLRNGPPVMLGWWPAFLIAVAAGFAWLILPKPVGRLVAISALAVLIFAPALLERSLIYQYTSNGVFLLLAVALVRLSMSIRQTLKLARSAADTKSWFLAQASHDLRQPIHAIGMLTAQLEQTKLSEAQADILAKIDRSVDGASRLFKSLLDVATLESGTLKPQIQPVAVNDIFAAVEEGCGLAAQQAGVSIRFMPSEAVIMTDRSLTTTMLQNLVSNAIKYASEKRVLIGCRTDGDTLSLCVYDRGAGISKAELKNAKRAFFRSSSLTNSSIEGAGLGLAIVNQLADLMALRFSLKSNLGHGTSARISGFRRAKGNATAISVQVNPATQPLTGLRVQIVDDDEDALRATSDLMVQWGCDVTTASIFPPTLAAIDILVSDFDFGNGKTLADERWKVDALTRQGVPTIVISGHHPDAVRSAMETSSLLVLSKPVRPAQLRSALLSARMSMLG
jgi:signal transduction histidine kinase